jgi:hypothetical protein
MRIPIAVKFLVSEMANKEFWLLFIAGLTAAMMMTWRTGLRDEIFRRAESFKWASKGR